MKNEEIKKLMNELFFMKSQISNLYQNCISKEDTVKHEKVAEKATTAGDHRFIEQESKNYPEWDEFEFITRKKGADGPSKTECLQNYSEK